MKYSINQQIFVDSWKRAHNVERKKEKLIIFVQHSPRATPITTTNEY